MANTYTQIHIHIVFAVEGRQSLIPPDQREELHKYITGIVENLGSRMIAINSMPDHIHMLVGQRPDIALSTLVSKVKSGSSAFITRERWVRGRFDWQNGFGAFSYARSQLPAVIRYIERQQEHHARRSFREEYRGLLERFQVPYDDRYLFRPIAPDPAPLP